MHKPTITLLLSALSWYEQALPHCDDAGRLDLAAWHLEASR